MGYYSDAETLTTRVGYAIFEGIVAAMAIFSICMINMLAFLFTIAILAYIEKSRYLGKKNKDNYVVFEENGIQILKYGNRENLYLEWNKIRYVYKWAVGSNIPSYYMLAEKPIKRRRRNRIIEGMIRNIEECLVIGINDEDPKSNSVEKIIQKKLSHIEIEEKKPWYRYYNKT